MKVSIGPYRKNGKPRRVKVELISDDLYSLDNTLALIILPTLKAFRDNPVGYPAFMTMGEWEEILNKMIDSFTSIVERDGEILTKEEEHREKAGLLLFGEYFRHLWQ